MSHLTYYAYKGVGERNQKQYQYSQAVRIGDRIECAGQGKHSQQMIEIGVKLHRLIYANRWLEP